MKLKSVRVIAGRDRGRKILYEESADLRPTPDRVRESLFNILQNDIQNAAVLDLFAGTGAFAFEALSRGAGYAVIADKSGDCVKNIKLNIAAFKIPADKYRVLHSDYVYAVKTLAGQRFDVIFTDPPFEGGFYADCVEKVIGGGLIDDGGVIVIETAADKELELPESAVITDTRVYGTVKLMFVKLKTENLKMKT